MFIEFIMGKRGVFTFYMEYGGLEKNAYVFISIASKLFDCMRKLQENSGGCTVWFTGLPSSGKSTLAQLLHQELAILGILAEVLDGDEIRQRLTKELGFSKKFCVENILRLTYVAKLLSRNGVIAITAAISPYQEMRKQARIELGQFVEVYVKCPLMTCMARDVKGLYAKAVRGEVSNFTGITDPYEAPLNPDVVLETDRRSPEECVTILMEKLANLNYISPSTVSHLKKCALPIG